MIYGSFRIPWIPNSWGIHEEFYHHNKLKLILSLTQHNSARIPRNSSKGRKVDPRIHQDPPGSTRIHHDPSGSEDPGSAFSPCLGSTRIRFFSLDPLGSEDSGSAFSPLNFHHRWKVWSGHDGIRISITKHSKNVVPVSKSRTSFFYDNLVWSETILFNLTLSNASSSQTKNNYGNRFVIESSGWWRDWSENVFEFWNLNKTMTLVIRIVKEEQPCITI